MGRSGIQPVLGKRGAVSAANPLAVDAALEMFSRGGNAVDAAIAAQAVLCVVAPEACGIGGDGLSLVARSNDDILGFNGTGKWGVDAYTEVQCLDGGNSVTVPGVANQWYELSTRYGKLDLLNSLLPAIRISEEGHLLTELTSSAVQSQRNRLIAGEATDWCIFQSDVGDLVKQPKLAETLRNIAEMGESWICDPKVSRAISKAVRRNGGNLDAQDFENHKTEIIRPPRVDFLGGSLYVQPPMSQGILLAMVAKWINENMNTKSMINSNVQLDHLLVELTEIVFQHRDRVFQGEDLLNVVLRPNTLKASRIGGPRAYLHTAGVATSDSEGMVVSSLVSVFDDFGSCVYVPELGATLNNRAGSFTSGDNRPRSGVRPVHTLAPAVWSGSKGIIGIATPGADGQIQTLIQVFLKWLLLGKSLEESISMPRWRSEFGSLLIEEGHEFITDLENLGHSVERRPSGANIFGAVVAAGVLSENSLAIAYADWRRQVEMGAT